MKLYLCVAIQLGKTNLTSRQYQIFGSQYVKEHERRFFSHYIIKFIVIHYVINLDIVYSLHLEFIDLL